MTPYAQAHIIGVFYCEGVIMTILLLLVIYIAYIGLGIPDSLFGPAWPAVHVDFGLGVHIAGYLTPLFSLFTVLSSLSSSRLIHRYGTWRVSAVSTALTAVGLLGFSFAPNLITLILFAIPLGSGAGAIDAGLNNYVAIHYSAAHMNFLHCFYGVGVSISPYLMALALSEKNNWHIGYRWAAYIQLGITAVMFLSYPLWKSAEKAELASASAAVRDASLRELAAIPGVRAAWLSFFSSVSMEYLCSTWGSTFLVEERDCPWMPLRGGLRYILSDSHLADSLRVFSHAVSAAGRSWHLGLARSPFRLFCCCCRDHSGLPSRDCFSSDSGTDRPIRISCT